MIAVPAYAKVNLALEVVRLRPDGYHELATVFATIDWHDLVSVTVVPRAGAGRADVTVGGPAADPTMAGPDALAARAAAALGNLAAAAIGRPVSVVVAVTKRVPVAAGLGGGSADAAAVLRAGAAATALIPGAGRISATDLASAAAHLGSDVPALLLGGVTLAAGRGEVLTPIPGTPSLDLAVAVAGASATVATYAAVTPAERRPDGRAAHVAASLAAGSRPDGDACGSALEGPATRVHPGLARRLTLLRDRTGLTWHLTGSGGAAFHLAADRPAAEAAAAAATALGIPARASRTVPCALLRCRGSV